MTSSAGFDWLALYASERARTSPPARTAIWATDLFRRHNVGSVLDLGCGHGRNSLYMAEHGLRVTGVDVFSPNQIPWLHFDNKDKSFEDKDNMSERFAYYQADAACLPFPDNHFQGIFCFGLLHCLIPDPFISGPLILKEVNRVLAPAGVAVFTALWTDTPEMGLPEICCLTMQDVSRLFALERRILSSMLSWQSAYPRSDDLPLDQEAGKKSGRSTGKEAGGGALSFALPWQCVEIALVDDFSLTGWEGIYWRFLYQK